MVVAVLAHVVEILQTLAIFPCRWSKSLHCVCLPHVCTVLISLLPHRTESLLTFWEFTARLSCAKSEEGLMVPRNMDLYWFMPALAKRRVGSECGTTEDEGTVSCISTNAYLSQALVLPKVCPFFLKKSMNVSRTRTAGHSSVVDPILGTLLPKFRALGGSSCFSKVGGLVLHVLHRFSDIR